MLLKIGNEILSDWEKWNSWTYARFINEDIYSISQCRIDMILNFNDEVIWVPKFYNKLEILQKIYSNKENLKEFSSKDDAKLAIDNFLIKNLNKINNLISFA